MTHQTRAARLSVLETCRLLLMCAALMLSGALSRMLARSVRRCPRPLAKEPDWTIGVVVYVYEAARRPEARLLYAQACSEWATRQIERKISAARISGESGTPPTSVATEEPK
jgi:hypothetical protein